MKSVLRLTALAFVSTALLLAGCSKKPQRPNPSQTVMGPGAGAGLAPTAIDTGDLLDPSAMGLEQRDASTLAGENQVRGVVSPVYFDFDSAAIRVSERAKVAEAVDYLNQNPGVRVLLEGHCDWRGTTEYNMGLGDRRASAVRDYMVQLGISPDRIETVSKGDLEATEGASEEQAQLDRRVEFVILQ